MSLDLIRPSKTVVRLDLFHVGITGRRSYADVTHGRIADKKQTKPVWPLLPLVPSSLIHTLHMQTDTDSPSTSSRSCGGIKWRLLIRAFCLQGIKSDCCTAWSEYAVGSTITVENLFVSTQSQRPALVAAVNAQ
jgi:hypothetical protein